MGYIPIKTYLHSSIAHIDKGVLEEQGIQAVVENDNTISGDGLLLGVVGYIQLSVQERDVEKAKGILKDSDNAGSSEQGDDDEYYICPKCKSKNITEYCPYAWVIIIPILFPLMFIKKKVCISCKHKWRGA
jgi:hypothetical protein